MILRVTKSWSIAPGVLVAKECDRGPLAEEQVGGAVPACQQRGRLGRGVGVSLGVGERVDAPPSRRECVSHPMADWHGAGIPGLPACAEIGRIDPGHMRQLPSVSDAVVDHFPLLSSCAFAPLREILVRRHAARVLPELAPR
jgi:hypothetical protein